MKFRYTLIRNGETKILTPSCESLAIKAYDYFIEKGYKVTKREIYFKGKFVEIL